MRGRFHHFPSASPCPSALAARKSAEDDRGRLHRLSSTTSTELGVVALSQERHVAQQPVVFAVRRRKSAGHVGARPATAVGVRPLPRYRQGQDQQRRRDARSPSAAGVRVRPGCAARRIRAIVASSAALHCSGAAPVDLVDLLLGELPNRGSSTPGARGCSSGTAKGAAAAPPAPRRPGRRERRAPRRSGGCSEIFSSMSSSSA